MRVILLFFILLLNLYASSNLLTYNIYERSDRVDIMLSFDSPYEGQIFQKRGENITVLTLNDLSYDKLIEKNINSKILQALSIEPEKDSLKVTLKSEQNIAVIASKTVDGFGLRIRSKPIQLPSTTTQAVPTSNNQKVEPLSNVLGSQTPDLVDTRYLSVVGVLFVFLLFMLWLKSRLKKGSNALVQNKNSWLFNQTSKNTSNFDVKILHKKAIDQNNSVALIEFEDKKYLVMTGSSNLLLERFGSSDIKDSSDFEKAFEENRKKLDDYLRLQDSGIDSYKSKASGDFRNQLENY